MRAEILKLIGLVSLAVGLYGYDWRISCVVVGSLVGCLGFFDRGDRSRPPKSEYAAAEIHTKRIPPKADGRSNTGLGVWVRELLGFPVWVVDHLRFWPGARSRPRRIDRSER